MTDDDLSRNIHMRLQRRRRARWAMGIAGFVLLLLTTLFLTVSPNARRGAVRDVRVSRMEH